MSTTGDRSRQVFPWVLLGIALLGVVVASLWRGPRERLLGGRSSVGRVESTAMADYGLVPEFALVSQTGDTVRLQELRDEVWIGDFIFTNCASSCPMMSAKVQELEADLGDVAGIRFVSFSVDPERDTPERLAEYARGYDASPERWLFLTGDQTQVRRLAVEGFHLPAEDASSEDIEQGGEPILHSTRLALVDREGRIRGYYDGMDPQAVRQLGVDARRLLSDETL